MIKLSPCVETSIHFCFCMHRKMIFREFFTVIHESSISESLAKLIKMWRFVCVCVCVCVCVHAKSLQSCLFFVTLWILAHQAPLSMGISRQEYWSGSKVTLQRCFPPL